MIEAYSNNVPVLANAPIPFNNVSVVKGCTVEQQNVNTFLFNKRGTYKVEFDAVAAQSTAPGNIVVQLFRSGVPQPQAITEAASTAQTDIEAMSFSTLVQVEHDNIPCCNVIPVSIQIKNLGVAAQFVQANIVITKLC